MVHDTFDQLFRKATELNCECFDDDLLALQKPKPNDEFTLGDIIMQGTFWWLLKQPIV